MTLEATRKCFKIYLPLPKKCTKRFLRQRRVTNNINYLNENKKIKIKFLKIVNYPK